jgi:hypothetical protein
MGYSSMVNSMLTIIKTRKNSINLGDVEKIG